MGEFIMKIWKRSILLFVAVAILLLSTITVSAVTETDNVDDVWYWEIDAGTGAFSWSSQKFTDHPTVDITSVGYTIDGSELTLTMTVNEAIDDSLFAMYMIYFGNYDEDYYVATYTTFTKMGMYQAVGIEGFDMGMLTDPLSGDRKTFTATFEIADPDPTFDVWGVTMEFKNVEDLTTGGGQVEYWGDFAPNTFGPGAVGDDDNDDDASGTDGTDSTKGTPGFETLAVIAALGVAFILLRRKK